MRENNDRSRNIGQLYRFRKFMLTKEEKEEVVEMLYKYKEVFSLRDEIGTCPNIEVEIDVTTNPHFFIRQNHVKKEDKALIDKEIK